MFSKIDIGSISISFSMFKEKEKKIKNITKYLIKQKDTLIVFLETDKAKSLMNCISIL